MLMGRSPHRDWDGARARGACHEVRNDVPRATCLETPRAERVVLIGRLHMCASG